jgi:hypothetical protein
MTMQTFFRTIRTGLLSIGLIACIFVPTQVFGLDVPAESLNFGLTNVDTSLALSNDRSVIEIISNIINIMLGLLGIIVLGLIIYAGFLWMTANGNDEQIATAKKIMTNAVIGLAIILSAYTITLFIFRSLADATGIPDPTNPNPSPCTSGTDCPPPPPCDTGSFTTACAEQTFFVKSITPSTDGIDGEDATFMSNTVVRVVFSQSIAVADIDGAVTVARDGVPIAMTASGKEQNMIIELIPETSLEIGRYTVTVNPDIKDHSRATLDLADIRGVAYPQSTQFYINRLVSDSQAPEILEFLVNGGGEGGPLFIGETLTVSFSASDRETIPAGGDHVLGGIALATIDILDGTRTVHSHDLAPRVRQSDQFGSSEVYSDAYVQSILARNFPTGRTYTIVLTVTDINENTTEARMSFPVYPASCGNGILDPGEITDDIGGLCGADAGDLCTVDADCSPHMQCNDDGICEALPIILDFDPKNAGIDNWVTIFGRFFGDQPGTVEFGYPTGENYTWIPASRPDANICPAGDLWHPTWTIVAIPDSLPERDDIAIRLTTAGADSEIEDTLDDDRGTITPFIRDVTERPGLCAVQNLTDSTAYGAPRDEVSVLGRGFVTDVSELFWGAIPGRITDLSSATALTAVVPESLGRGVVGVRVQNEDVASNGVPFTVETLDIANLPVISYIDPVATTTRGSYITLFGSGFGAPYGTVHIASTTENALACADGSATEILCHQLDTILQPSCGVTWGENEVILSVIDVLGSTINSGEYALVLTTIDGVQTDGLDTIRIVNGDTLPSICSISPNIGPAPLPVGQTIALVGTKFENTRAVRFWNIGADTGTVDTIWLEVSSTEFTSYTPERIETKLPFDTINGLSIPTGAPVPIRIETDRGFSNAVTYTVNECTPASTTAGLKCCTVGPNAGRTMPAGFACPGEIRSAGYTWRIASGIIPAVPRVLEQCIPANTTNPVAVPPSPAPSTLWNSGLSACTNALVTVAFSLTMDADSIDTDSVRLHACSAGQGRGCDTDINLADNFSLSGDNRVLSLYDGGTTALLPDTWYRVEIDKSVQSIDISTIANREVTQYRQLEETRGCGDDTAYCYDFKTSAFGEQCELIGAYVIPSRHTISELGPVADMLGNLTQFQVLGETNMECIPISTRGLGWNWQLSNATGATIAEDLEDNIPVMIDLVTAATDDIRTLVANQEVPEQPLTLEAEIDETSNGYTGTDTITGSSTIVIALGDPEVRTYWPNCSAACSNATLGVVFNRNMMTDTFTTNNVTVRNCGTDRFCATSSSVSISIPTDRMHARGFDIIPVAPLDRDSWYEVRLSDEIFAIGGYDTDGAIIPGDAIDVFAWGFKTKASFDGCFVTEVIIDPERNIAQMVGERNAYNATPYGTPDECSPYGQRLNPFDFDWNWEIPAADDQEVAALTNTSIAFQSAPGCTENCTPAGSDRARQDNTEYQYICGNGVLDPGETCDIGMTNEIAGNGDGAYTCSYSCQRPGNATVGDASGQCGDGIVDNPQSASGEVAGESCDAGDQNGLAGSGCSNVCTFTGSAAVFTGELLAPYCSISENVRDGILDAGEACEIDRNGTLIYRSYDGGIPIEVANLKNPRQYCSDTCSVGGTQLSEAWCDESDRRATVPECYQATSICGNGTIETGESCEIISSNAIAGTSSVRVLTDNPSNPTQSHVIEVASSEAARICTPSCLLGYICDVKDLFEDNNPNVWCDRTQEEGCSNLCTPAGSSLSYEALSQCRDSLVGTGEYNVCEVSASDLPFTSPTQIATALGQSSIVDPVTFSQETSVQVTTVGFRDVAEDGTPTTTAVVGGDQITAVGEYLLQCGYEESADPVTIDYGVNSVLEYNDCPNAEHGYTDGVASNTCCYPRPAATSTYPAAPLGGDRVGVCRNTLLEVSYGDTIIEKSTAAGNVVLAKQIEYTSADLDADLELNPLPTCADEGLSDITDIVQGTLGEGAESVVLTGNFFQRTWTRMHGWLASLISRVFAASSIIDVSSTDSIWCDSGILLDVDVVYTPASEVSGTSTIRITPKSLLDADTVYAVLLRSGADGITDNAGVSIQPINPTTLYDGFPLRTGDEICKITEISVTPDTHLFRAPFEHNDFVIEAITAQGERIVPIADVYDWQYLWAPQTSDLFFIPVTNAAVLPVAASVTIYDATSAIASLAARDIEAQQTVQGRVLIITDTATEAGDQTGKMFTSAINLYARFCSNPWGSVDPAAGVWSPYTNERFNFEFWYCADARSPLLTSDDLPILDRTPLALTTNRDVNAVSVCTSGLNDQNSCDTDADCSTLQEVTVSNTCDISKEYVTLSVCADSENDGDICTDTSDCIGLSTSVAPVTCEPVDR